MAWADGAEIEITVDDARRCNRLRGLSVADCVCRRPDANCFDQCPPGALGLLDAGVLRDVAIMLGFRSKIDLPALGAQPLKRSRTIAPKTEVLTGELCREPGCGGFLVRTGSCMTCQTCGNNEGCG